MKNKFIFVISLLILLALVAGYKKWQKVKKEIENLNQSFLVGSWHAMPSVAAGYSDRYVFYENGEFIFLSNQFEKNREILGQLGSWKLSDNKLSLVIKNTVDLSQTSKELNQLNELNIGKIEMENPEDSPYKEKLLIGDDYYWHYSTDTNLWVDDIKYLKGE